MPLLMLLLLLLVVSNPCSIVIVVCILVEIVTLNITVRLTRLDSGFSRSTRLMLILRDRDNFIVLSRIKIKQL